MSEQNWEHIYNELTEIIEGDVDISDEARTAASTDWSLFTVMPQMVIFPKHAGDIAQLVTWVNTYNASLTEEDSQKISITARAAGTGMSGGSLNSSIILDVTRYMQGVLEVAHTGGYPDQTAYFGHGYSIRGHARVLPGTWYRDFEDETLADNLLLPCYPASKDICAVGGMVANNGAGEKSLKYGQNKDFVHAVRVVLADGNEYLISPLSKKELDLKMSQNDFEGNLYRQIWELVRDHHALITSKKPTTSKNAAGYYLWDVIDAPSIDSFVQGRGYFDLTKLIVGAQGTTGIITEITYKLIEKESHSDLLVVYVDTLDQVPELVSRLMQSDLEMLEMYDDHTFKVGVKFFKDFLKDKGLIKGMLYGMRFLPEVWQVLVHGMPKLFVLASFVSNDEEGLHSEMQTAVDQLSDMNLRTKQVRTDASEAKFWDFRHDSFKLLSEHSKKTKSKGFGTRTAPFIDDIAVNPEHLPEYLPRLIEILEREEFVYTIAGHLGNGNFHIIPLMDMAIPENRDKIARVSEEVYLLASEYGASITAEHNDGIIRTPFLPIMFGERMVGLFERVKNIFDPEVIFNPGKKVGLTKEDIDRLIG